MILTFNHNGSVATLSNQFVISKIVEVMSNDPSVKESGIGETFEEMCKPKFNIMHPSINYNLFDNRLVSKIATTLLDIKKKFEMGEEESLKNILIADIRDISNCIEMLSIASKLPPGSGNVNITIATI